MTIRRMQSANVLAWHNRRISKLKPWSRLTQGEDHTEAISLHRVLAEVSALSVTGLQRSLSDGHDFYPGQQSSKSHAIRIFSTGISQGLMFAHQPLQDAGGWSARSAAVVQALSSAVQISVYLGDSVLWKTMPIIFKNRNDWRGSDMSQKWGLWKRLLRIDDRIPNNKQAQIE